jgi:hypothetical protein
VESEGAADEAVLKKVLENSEKYPPVPLTLLSFTQLAKRKV